MPPPPPPVALPPLDRRPLERRPGPVRLAAIGDLHAHATQHGAFRPLFAEVSERADVLALCGDLTNLGAPEEAEALAADLAALRVPAVAVLGNHDHHGQPAEVKRILKRASVHFLDEEEFELGEVGIAGVKGFAGGFDGRMLSSFGEEAIKRFVGEAVNEALALENALKSLTAPRKVVAMHYAPIPDTIVGESPEIFPFLGCSRLAETLDRFDDVALVVHGHAHHGSYEGRTRKGIPVFNVCSAVLQRVHGRAYMIYDV